MNITSDRERIIFNAALELSGSAQESFLAAQCAGDEALRSRIQGLLQAHDEAGCFLDEPAGTVVIPASEKPGDRIGRYKLLQQIGEGGCGVVYMAEQEEPVRRRVALKVIKLGMDTKEVIARFEAERQALAMMEHPNIAKVLDAGATDKGRPYFVMELVRGIKITDYCDQNNLSAHERLGLFIQICHAIQHAHQKGIIHRDIKPSNILVTINDGVAVPKVIDFGIAKATLGRLTDKTVFTAFEQFIGTPAYMSPEQAVMTSLDIDTRSDIYSLGVLLYELLTGQTPFDAKDLLQKGLDEIRRTIREQEPARPSTCLSTMQGAALTVVAKQRKVEPPGLIHLVRGDLDWIVMKALDKDRTRRYETASGLAGDVQRHLNNEPVVARPPSSVYRFQKMIRRNKLVCAAAGAVALALVAGLGLSTWSLLRERQANAEKGRLLYAANMNLAQQAWEQNNIGQLEQLLTETQAFPDRGFEWYYWQRLTHLSLQTYRGHTNYVASVAFSPDGQRIVTGSEDSTAKVWDTASGRELLTLKGHARGINSVAFSPDGQWIVTGSDDKTAKVWDAASGRELLTLKANNGKPIASVALSPLTDPPNWTRDANEPVSSVAFSPDGRQVLSGGQNNMATLWDAASGRELLTFKGHTAWINSVAFFQDGRRIVTGGWDRTAKVWDTASGRELFTLKGHTSWITSVAASPDGKRIATGSRDGTAKVWDAANGRELLTLKGHAEGVNSVAFSPDSLRIVTGSYDQTAKVWDAASGRELLALKGHNGEVLAVTFSPDGRQILIGSEDHTARLWNATNTQEPLIIKGHGMISSVAFSPDSQRIVSGGEEKTTTVWEVASGRELLNLNGHAEWVTSVGFSPDGQRIVTGDSVYTGRGDQTARVWDASSGRELLTLKGHLDHVYSAAFSPDGRRIVAGSSDQTVKLWDAASGQELLTLRGFGGEVRAVTFSPDSRRILTGSVDNIARLWDAANGRKLLACKGHNNGIFCVAFSPDGRRFATGSFDKTARIWDASSGRELLTLKGHNADVHSVAFSPDSKRIVTGSFDQTAKVWDAVTGRELLTLKGHTNSIWSVAFSPDGQRIVTGGADQTIRVWEAARKDQVAQWQAEEAKP